MPTKPAQHMFTSAELSSSVVGLFVEYFGRNSPAVGLLLGFALRGLSASRARNSSRVSLLMAVFAPEALTRTPLDDADEEDRARLLIPDEMLESTEAHDLLLADLLVLTDGDIDDARDGDLSRI